MTDATHILRLIFLNKAISDWLLVDSVAGQWSREAEAAEENGA
jgi:hypothetical protein